MPEAYFHKQKSKENDTWFYPFIPLFVKQWQAFINQKPIILLSLFLTKHSIQNKAGSSFTASV